MIDYEKHETTNIRIFSIEIAEKLSLHENFNDTNETNHYDTQDIINIATKIEQYIKGTQ